MIRFVCFAIDGCVSLLISKYKDYWKKTYLIKYKLLTHFLWLCSNKYYNYLPVIRNTQTMCFLWKSSWNENKHLFLTLKKQLTFNVKGQGTVKSSWKQKNYGSDPIHICKILGS